MTAREYNPRRLDVRALAQDAAELEGDWPLTGFDRLSESLAAGADRSGLVSWHAHGFEVPVRGGAAQTWLALQARALVPLVCQRCLQVVDEPLVLERRFLFAADENAAAQLDGEIEDDVLVLTRELDLHGLVEDELLLDLPLVPRHEVCPQPLEAPAETPDPGVEQASPHPFAALAALRKRGD